MGLVAWCLLSFNGRIGRKPFILGFVLCMCVSALFQPLWSEIFLGDRTTWTTQELVVAEVKAALANSLLTMWPSLALYTKRLRDTGLPVWTLVIAMPFAGTVFLLQPTVGLLLVGMGLLFLIFVPGRRFERSRA